MTEQQATETAQEPQEGTQQPEQETATTQETATAATEPDKGEDKGEAWDPERAKAKIRNLNSENRALREREAAAQQAAAAVPDLESQNQTLGSENLRLRVGYELGLPMNLAERLRGSTREELLADAESLVELVAPTKSTPTSGRPVVALKPGATAETVTPPQDDSYPSHWLPQRQSTT